MRPDGDEQMSSDLDKEVVVVFGEMTVQGLAERPADRPARANFLHRYSLNGR